MEDKVEIEEEKCEVITFEEIWNKLSVDEQLEDAFAKLLSSYSQINTVKEAYSKLTVGHGRNIQNWRVDSNDFKTNGIPNDELDKIFDAMEGTADVVEADAHLKRIREIFDNAKNDANMEDALFEHWLRYLRLITTISLCSFRNGFQRYIEDVNKCTRDYIMNFSVQLNDLGNKLQNEVELYKQREDEVLLTAENAIEKVISDEFKKYRLQKLRNHRTQIQQHHESEMALQLKQFREANEQRNNELKSIDELKTQVANLKMDLSAQSLIRLRRLAVVDDKLLKRQQQVVLLDAKRNRINDLVEKRKKAEKQLKEAEKFEKERREKEEQERKVTEQRLMKRGLLVYQKVMNKK